MQNTNGYIFGTIDYSYNKLQHIPYSRFAAKVDQSRHSKTEWFDGLGSCCAARESPRFSYPNETNSCIGNLNLSLYHPKRSAKEMHK
jgi:hypothetical protein